MIIGVPKEIKNNEFRVGLTPDSVKKLTNLNHQVFVEESAGKSIGFLDSDYASNGAQILKSPKEIFDSSELIIKVKEPLPSEFKYLSSKNILFTYLHLAGNIKQSLDLVDTGVTGIAYETVTDDDGSLPLLSPMSSIAGQLSIIVGSYFLLKHNKGKGTLIGSVSGLDPRIVTVIGAGVAGTEAIEKALSNKAHVKIIELSDNRLNELQNKFGNNNIEYITIINIDNGIETLRSTVSRKDLVESVSIGPLDQELIYFNDYNEASEDIIVVNNEYLYPNFYWEIRPKINNTLQHQVKFFFWQLEALIHTEYAIKKGLSISA